MKKIDKSILPEGYNTDKSEDGFYAEFYDDGQLAHYGYYVDGELDDRWALHIEEGTMVAFAQRIITVGLETQEEASNNGHGKDLSAQQEEEFVEFIEHWVERITADNFNLLPRCSFCEKTASEVPKLIAGPNSFICNECVELCNEILAEEESQNE
jgi:hypothetical protein